MNQILGRNIPADPEVRQILEEGEVPMPKLGRCKRYFYGIFELIFTFVVSVLPIWETDLYIRLFYHNIFGQRIKNMHKQEENVEEIEMQPLVGNVQNEEAVVEEEPEEEIDEEEEGVIREEIEHVSEVEDDLASDQIIQPVENLGEEEEEGNDDN